MINVKGFSGVWHQVSLLSRIRKAEREQRRKGRMEGGRRGKEDDRMGGRGRREWRRGGGEAEEEGEGAAVRSSPVVMGTPQAPEPAPGDTLRLEHTAQEPFPPSSISKADIPR